MAITTVFEKGVRHLANGSRHRDELRRDTHLRPDLTSLEADRSGGQQYFSAARMRAWYASRVMRPMTTEMTRGDCRPYFLWDEDVSIDELRVVMSNGPRAERLRLLGKMLREARDIDVWHFVSPSDVARELPLLARRLGRRRAFWEFLIDGWRKDGILAA